MPLRNRKKKLWLAAGVLAAFLLLICISLPLWWPWVLRPLARQQGARYVQYQRAGYGRFVLIDFTLTNRTARFSARRVEANVPITWLWRLATGRTNSPQPFLQLNQWRYEVITAPPAASATAHTSTASEAADLLTQLRQLARWLPRATLSNGTVVSGSTVLEAPSANWNEGHLSGEVAAPPTLGAAIIALDVTRTPVALQLTAEQLHLQSNLALTRTVAGLNIKGQADWWTNRLQLQAQFSPNGVLPESASVHGSDLRLPASVVQLPQYRELTGSLEATWRAGQFGLDLRAAAHPLPGETNYPPVDLVLHAAGDTNAAVIQQAALTSPWLKARLSHEVTVHWSGPVLRRPCDLLIEADLAHQPWVTLHGILRGDAHFAPTGMKLPRVDFRLGGSDIANASLTARQLELEGHLEWPWLELSSAAFDFSDGSAGQASGRVDLQQKVVQGGQVRFQGPLARRWLPAGYSYDTLAFTAHVQGPFTNLAHSGHLLATNLTSPTLRPLELRADWIGQSENLKNLTVSASAAASALEASCSLSLSNGSTRLELSKLVLLTNNQPVLQLTEPGRFEARRTEQGVALECSPIRLSGTAGYLALTGNLRWPAQGTFELSASNISSRLTVPWLNRPLPAVQVRQLSASGTWSNTPGQFQIALSAEEQGIRNPPITAELALHGDANGLVVSNLVLGELASPAVRVQGSLPLTLSPADKKQLVHFLPEQPLRLTARAEPQAFFWSELARWTGVTLRQPALNLDIGGTWQTPQGKISLGAQRVQIQTSRTNLPAMENLHLQLALARQQARLTQGELLVQGQRVSLTGQLPLGKAFWNGLPRGQMPDWKQASARLRIEDADVAAFAPLFPTLLAPEGALDVDLNLEPGVKLQGGLTLQRARTRPLGSFGPIRDIQVQLRFQNQTIRLENASGRLSSAPIQLTGQVELHGLDSLHGQIPPFTLTLRGTDVPLARQPEFIVRSDLDLSLVKTNGAPPLISGNAHLRDSFYLSDLRALVPGKVAGPTRRPPYFSIDEPTVADWRLRVSVDGVRFLKVRSPLFNGELSANMRLLGTLKDPIALGDLRTDSGTVRFPFGSLAVQQGLVSLSSEDPYRPQLAVKAASKQYGYDIRLEVSGSADSPVIQFNSTPPLSSEQILLMVTAGQLPQGTFTLTPQQRAQTLAMFLGRDILAKLGIGDQSQERLTIRSGEEISDQGRPTYHVEYKLTHRWALVGEYDRFGDFNAGLKWRIYSK